MEDCGGEYRDVFEIVAQLGVSKTLIPACPTARVGIILNNAAFAMTVNDARQFASMIVSTCDQLDREPHA